ncbi:MAG TPA: flagellar hook capping FlgD N-terminal domain-containing protein [Verrucomicrobiae bacterium]|jgi:flagellar basal-body rod modification protein FlgD|nr:flagellar hook capping FlgD N-terminal domain-containing protein [Verrucomicrobiae bacterium]
MTVPSATTKTAGQTAAPTSAATTASSAASSTPDTFTNPSSTLNQADFLKLLVAQIQYQDPMNPQSDTQMASQMAQFTSLQQATQSTNSLAMMQANSLIGSTVGVQIDSTHSASGVVTGVVLNNGAPQITINGANYGLSQVTSVVPVSAGSATGATTPASSSSSNGTTGDPTDSSGTTTPTTQTTN